MSGPDLSKLTPTLTAAVIIALITAAVVLEATDSPNTLIILTVLIAMLGLQQTRNSQATKRIEHQTNGGLTARLDPIVERLQSIEARLERGDVRFDHMEHENTETTRAIAEIKTRIDQLTSCETKPAAPIHRPRRRT